MHQRNKTFLKSVQRYKTLSLYCMVYYMVFSVTNRSRKGFSAAVFPQQGFPGKDSLQLIFRNEFFTFSVFNIRNTFGIMVAMVLDIQTHILIILGPFSDGKGFNLWYLTKKI